MLNERFLVEGRMAERNVREPHRPPPPPPRVRRRDPLTTDRVDAINNDIYEEVNFRYENAPRDSSLPYEDDPSPDYHDDSSSYEDSSEAYIEPSTILEVVNEYDYTRTHEGGYTNEQTGYINQTRGDASHSYDYSNDHRSQTTSNDLITKIDRSQRNPKEFLDAFESTRDEMRTDEETFIIVHLLKKNSSNSPVLNGDLEPLALLACCSSPHVVKRALDALLNEIFLSISDFSRIRCRNILQAEKIIRQSFHESLQVDHVKAKCQRMTTYAWLITFVLLKCSKEECDQITREIKAFDKTLDILLKENIERKTFRYGIHLARETIKRIVLLSERKDPKEPLSCSIKRCANILNSRLDENEVTKLGKVLGDEGSWLNLHVCLAFLQDLPKFHQFQGNLKPIILIQMLVQDFRNRCSPNRFRRSLRMANSEPWRFETLVYHVMFRLISTSGNDDAITEQVLLGKQGCGGVFSAWSESKSRNTRNSLVMENLEKICKRVVFQAPSICFERLITCIGNGTEKNFIEDLAILRLSSKYKDKVLEILPKLKVRRGTQRVSTYDALMSGKKCVLKLYRHSKEEILKATGSPKTEPLRKEIEIVKVLNALAEPCPNLVQLLGSSIEAPMHMIIERGSKGDLLTFLNKHLNFIEAQSLVQIALDICSAMLFIHSQNIIHRDLRASNCYIFMQDGKLLAKIGDFHLAAFVYSGPRSPTNFKQRNNSTTSMTVEDIFSQFAVSWMAVETLQFGEFSTASDVWSYGVLLFEIFTLGSQPYVNMPSGLSLNSDEDVRKYVTNGNRLELHPRIPESLQVIIQSTMVDADHRPTFSDLKDSLLGMKFADDTYVDSSYFQISHDNGNPSADIIDRPISASTACTANGCVGECLNASDVAVLLNIDSNNFMRQFVPASSRDILKLPQLECPSLAIITAKIFHDEKLELLTEVGDMGSLKQFINEYGCSMENAMRFLSQIGEAVKFLHNRRFIHRNLRADSVFVYSNGNVKLASFGRVRKLKPNADDQSSTIPINLPLPDDSLRWSSPEVIADGEYSKASDMWAFGVMIWETFILIDKELGEISDEEIIPYNQLSSKGQILSYLRKEKRLGKPSSCPDWLYEMMLRCWENNTRDRAKVQDIMNCINEHTSKYSSPYQAVVDPLH